MKEPTMKKIILLIVIPTLLFVSLAVINNVQKNQTNQANNDAAQRLYATDADQLNPETVKLLKDKNYQTVITKQTLLQKLKNKDDFYVYFFSPTCPHCKRSTAHVNAAFKQVGLNVYQYNVLEDQSAFAEYQFDATPTIIHFQNGVKHDQAIGEISNEVNHAYTPESFVTWLKEQNN
jgi:thiol-disulfide isomerase/thioredoxin